MEQKVQSLRCFTHWFLLGRKF